MLQINEVVTGIGAAATAPVGGNAMMAVKDTNNTVALGHGLGNEVMHSMSIRMNRMEQVQAQSQQTLLNAISEMQTQHRQQFQVLNNNIRCFGGCIEGSLVRQVNSNQQQRLLAMNQADGAAPMEALNDAQLNSQPCNLITLW
jgi:predicted transcriptional regulator